jgi:hypothetical protein
MCCIYSTAWLVLSARRASVCWFAQHGSCLG